MFGIATIKETYRFYKNGLPFSGIPLPFSTRQWEYPWCYLRLLDFDLHPGCRLLDVGCACNPFMIHLANMGYDIVGLDQFSSDNLLNPDPEFGGFDCRLENDHLTFCEANMEKIPLPDNSFDAVYCISVLEHCDESTRLSGITEMLRVLKPGRPLIITEDYIPKPIEPLAGILLASERKMDYDFRDHIAATGRPLFDSKMEIPSDKQICHMRNSGELLLNCAVDPADYYHFTAVGWVICK